MHTLAVESSCAQVDVQFSWFSERENDELENSDFLPFWGPHGISTSS